MVFPAGLQSISAMRGDSVWCGQVFIDSRTADTLEMARKAHSVSGQRPYFDYDHSEEAASGWPTKFYWKPDGVYASVEWSESGAESIAGRDYRSFSPAFFTNDDSPARITGAPFCMGGLVNDPAFREMAPLWASAAMGSMTVEARNLYLNTLYTNAKDQKSKTEILHAIYKNSSYSNLTQKP